MPEYGQPDFAPRSHVPEMEQRAYNQKPKTSEWRELRLKRYEGTDLYQWFGKRSGSIFEDACDEPFLIARQPPVSPAEQVGWIEASIRTVATGDLWLAADADGKLFPGVFVNHRIPREAAWVQRIVLPTPPAEGSGR